MGYPLATLHPHVAAWFADIHKRPDFYKEVATPLPLRVISRGLQTVHRLKGKHIGAYLR